jgi:ATP-binding cassette subfamily B protein
VLVTNPHIAAPLARWRALLGLLWSASRWKLAGFGALVVLAGVLPTAAIVLTGALVRAIPAAVQHGLTSPEGRAALTALAALLGCLAALSLAGNVQGHLARVIGAAFRLEVHQTVGRAMLGSPGLAPLEDPALADRLHAVKDADNRGVLFMSVASLSEVAAARMRGVGAFLVLLAFAWWAPLLLAAAWLLSSLEHRKATENGVSVTLSDGAVKMRRSEYMRSLALEAPAAKEIRVFGLGPWVVERYADAWLDALGAIWASRTASRWFPVATAAALAVSHAVVLGAMVAAAASGHLTGAALLVFVQAIIATSDLGAMGDHQFFLSQTLAMAGAVDALRPAVSAPPARPAVRVPALVPAPAPAESRVSVKLEGVRFTYRGREDPVLDGLTLEIPAGQSLAIVGENGSGKSTLVKLVCGLYEPDAGRVLLDGGLSPLEARARRRIGVIFQDFVRYPLPLRENIAFGHLPLVGDRAALEGALRDAGGGGLPAGLPDGWNTVLSREFAGGADLSGGQWQRVALARALAAVRGGAGLLILDEPTAALDVRAETELFDRFLEVTRGVTTILVSHRLSSVRRADRIVVLGEGRVVEDGTHDELMRRGGLYARMFSLQAERFSAAAQAPAAGEEVAHA